MKARSVLRARENHPASEGLSADTAESNAPMRRVDEALGHGPAHQSFQYQLGLRAPSPGGRGHAPATGTAYG
ncbi:hypothetical protein ACFU6R_32185, partial [Streptomyces sp. NPDC057499]